MDNVQRYILAIEKERNDLRRQLAECQKERDEWSSAMEVYWKLANERLTALTECQQERDGLRAGLVECGKFILGLTYEGDEPNMEIDRILNYLDHEFGVDLIMGEDGKIINRGEQALGGAAGRESESDG